MSLRIAIVGAGIGGLAAALFLRRAGLQVQVFEQARELKEVGAGLVVPPNMVRPLRRLGLEPALERCAVRLESAWEFRRWDDGRVLSVQAMGAACRALYDSDCYVAHRADLLALLHEALPAEVLQLDRRCKAVDASPESVRLSLRSHAGEASSSEAFDAVIGADGIHSSLQTLVGQAPAARFSGLCAFRCLVPAERAPAMALRPVQTLWLGPGRHFVHYPISAGRWVNVVAIVPAGDWRQESWTAEGDVAELARAFEGWDPRLQQLIAAATHTKRWAMVDRDPLPHWHQGRLALLGDAAHAMLPFFAQGAAQAVEDAEALAECLRDIESSAVPAALARYDALRRPRASLVQTMSRGRELQNHLPDGPDQQQRDAMLAGTEPLRSSAWLYGHDLARGQAEPSDPARATTRSAR